MKHLACLLLLLACDDGGSGPISVRDQAVGDAGLDRGLDAGPRDAVVDARRPDARLPDARVRDTGPVDAGPADARPLDARPADARILDARVADASPPDARAVDMRPPPDARPADAGPPPPCEGIVLPPPPDSPDGREVCNYRDDDGDGLVDEGFAYDFLGEPVRITQEPQRNPRDFRIVWTGQQYGVAWTTAFGLNFVTLAASGCPTSRIWLIDQNPQGDAFAPNSGDMAFAGNRFAAIFTQSRVGGPGSGIGTFVQLFDLGGRPVGPLIDLDRGLSFFGKNAIVPFGDNFAVFASAFSPGGGLNYSYFAILDQDGRVVLGPSHPYDPEPGQGQAMSGFIGMAFDGEGFGMAWVGDGTWFMRWSPEGNVLVPPRRYGALGQRSGIAWTGEHFVVPSDTLFEAFLDFIDPAGQPAAWSPVSIGRSENGWAGVGLVVEAQRQTLVKAGVGRLILRRYGQNGAQQGEDQRVGRLDPLALVDSGTDIAALVVVDWDPVVGAGNIALTHMGCPQLEGR